MGAAPIWIPVCPMPPEPPTGFGSLLSVLSLGLIKDPPKPPSQTAIKQQIGTQVLNQLNAQGWSTDAQAAIDSAGYNLNLLGAWNSVLTDSNATQSVVNKVISDLLGSGLVFVSVGQPHALAKVNPDGSIQGVNDPATVATQVQQTAFAASTFNPTLLYGGAAAVALLLLLRR